MWICADQEPNHFGKLDPNLHQGDADKEKWLYAQIKGEQGTKENALTNISVDISVILRRASSILAPGDLLRLASGLLLGRWRSAPRHTTDGSTSYSGAPSRGTSSSGNCPPTRSGTSALET